MANDAPISLSLASPVGWMGRQVLALLAYLGGVASVFTLALRSLFQKRDAIDPLIVAVGGQLSWIFAMGFPLVALVHVGLGSFLSMQSYFGGTFVEGTGAVVGVGLLRNVAALMACLTMAGLLAARITPELRGKWRVAQGAGLFDRTASGVVSRPAPVEGSDPGRDVAARIIAATLSGPILSFWGATVGTVVGWQVSGTLLGVSTNTFFDMFFMMVWVRDVIGLGVKGLLFGFAAGLLACHEGLRSSPEDDFASVSAAACRAACLASLAILVINSGWFILVYHAGPAFGPTLLAPATP
jgi:phospholipid/cholesterol/gamma-HCH transport system permease protein